MIRKLTIGVMAALALTAIGWTNTASASVSGKSYAVTVFTNFTGTFDDILTFNADGTLTSDLGPVGLWTETDYGPLATWNGNLTTVTLSGIQLGPLLIGNGHDAKGRKYFLLGRQSP